VGKPTTVSNGTLPGRWADRVPKARRSPIGEGPLRPPAEVASRLAGRQARVTAPMSDERRAAAYLAQTGRKTMTPRQARRWSKKGGTVATHTVGSYADPSTGVWAPQVTLVGHDG
jgi:hypothetical protein